MTPDVSVIVAVYNTGDLLPTTLASLAGQTLDSSRVQVVLVDDGSTDASAAIIDEFAASYPGPVATLHQENSGGPAAPFNRGLELATGRYVFFLGSDDHLWDEALERLVAAADAWESDVVFGRIVGLSGHGVATRVYRQGTTRDLDLYTSLLPYALSNSKLFRRSLVEDLGLRYREDMRQRCDQPFTLTAIVRGRRTSMLADHDFYFAEARNDRSNVTYTADYDESLRSTEIVMATIAELIEPGPRRDHVMKRQFDTSLVRVLDRMLLQQPEEVQRTVLSRVAGLVEQHLTPELEQALIAEDRVRMHLARDGDLAGFRQVVEALGAAADGTAAVPLVVEGSEVFVGLPGFRSSGPPDASYESSHRLINRTRAALSTTGVVGDPRRGLTIDLELAIRGLAPGDVRAVLTPVDPEIRPARARKVSSKPFAAPAADLTVTTRPSADGLHVELVVPPSELTSGSTVAPRLRVVMGRFEYDLPIQAPDRTTTVHPVRRRLRTHHVTVSSDDAGRLLLGRTAPAPPHPPSSERGEP